jgi:hypothetical protein
MSVKRNATVPDGAPIPRGPAPHPSLVPKEIHSAPHPGVVISLDLDLARAQPHPHLDPEGAHPRAPSAGPTVSADA